MKTKRTSIPISSLILPLIFCFTLPVEAARPAALRYRFFEGQTNAYKIEIEVRDESGTNLLSGNIVVTPRAGGSNTFCVNLRGTLSPRRVSMPRPMFNGLPRAGLSPITLQSDSCEIQFDDCGRILREMGDFPLPVPLGSIAQLLIEPFPANAESRWETTDELAVLDEPLSLGPSTSFLPSQPYGMSYYNPPFNPRGGIAAVRVTRKVRYEIKSGGVSDLTTVTKHLALASRLQDGSESRVSASGDGEFIFDREAGLIRQFGFQCKAIANTESLTRRTAISLRVKLLEGQEREAAVQSPVTWRYSSSDSPARKLTAEEVQKITEDLKSTDKVTRSQAASKLLGSDLPGASPALLELMSGLLNDNETSVRWAAAKVVADYGTAEQVPLLLKLLNSSDSSARGAAVRGLGRLKDKRAAEPLAAMIASGGSAAHQAVDALGNIGPDAEGAVLPLLQEKHIETRRQACNALGQIGTKKSLEPLRDLMLDPDQMLSSAAAEAVRAIIARQ